MKINLSQPIALGFGLLTAISPVLAQNKTAPTQKKLIDVANMDLSVKPGDDFYTYANGTWLKNNPIPAKEVRWGSFNVLNDFNINAVKTILTQAKNDKTAKPGSIEKRVGDFYAAGMDSITIEKLGFTPIKADLASVESINNIAEVLNAVATMRTKGIASPLFSFYVDQDAKHPEEMIANLNQGGTTLPDRDYYLKDDERSKKIRAAYHDYVVKLFTLTGTPAKAAEQYAKDIFAIEKSLAAAKLTRVEMRDPYKTYHKFAINDLSKTTPGLNWEDLLKKMKVTGQDSILVDNPAFFVKESEMLKTIPLSKWKVYLKWNVLKNAANNLSSPFVDASFKFSQALSGQKVPTPRWQKMSSLTDGTIGELLGQLYVKEYFKPEAKARMKELVSNLSKAFENRIEKQDWMSDATKQKALDKLHAFTPKIGYPDKWETYDGLVINRATYFKNLRNANEWQYNKMIAKLGKPVDKTKWGMTPPTVNAYYNPVINEIVFPAGILQFPFFDPNADDAVNYGGIGSVIGHEMSHGFDDEGSQYDKDGTLRNWWTAEDAKNFKARTEKLVDQFNAYTILDTVHVNGKLTLGENIGDLGGLNVAYEAFKMTKQGQSDEKIDGFTPDQRFFLAWAQVWRINILPETAAQFIIVDPHSPGQYRTIGPLVNMDAWYKAFNVKEGDKLYKASEDRIRIW
ncbi:MAG TPA: M13 family metallopeptidase [Pelobium sp.]